MFVKTSGLDLYTYAPELKSLELIETKKMNVSWYIYTHESRLVLLASGMQCKSFTGYQLSSAGVIRLPRFEMRIAKADVNSKPVLAAEDVHIVTVYGRIYCLHVDRVAMLLHSYRFYREAVIQQITPKVLQVWAKILCAVPNSRLIVKCKPFCCDSVRQRFLSTLEQLGLESLHVDLLPLILLNHDHMQAYSPMDISLDTFPYAGTATTCESLYMGVPCLTMGGSVHAHNVGVSLLSAVGLEHLVAKTEDEYIRLAIQLASDVTALSNLRMDLRNLMSNSPLCNGSKFINGLESAYRDIWRGYCKGNIPSLKRMEMLQNQNQTPQITSLLSKDDPFGSIKENGFSLGHPRLLTSGAIEENGSQANQSSSSGQST